MKIIADNQQRVMVDFVPAPGLTHNMIVGINRMTTQFTPQELASYIASYVAAFAFVLHSNNSTEQVATLFRQLAEDAGKQYEHRKTLLEKEANNPLKFSPND